MKLEELLEMTPRQLGDLSECLFPVPAQQLVGWRYRGVSLGLPHWLERWTWKTFAKDFIQAQSEWRGWNVRLEQTGLDGPTRAQMRGDTERTFGHFALRQTPNGALIDYGLAQDPLRAFTPNDPTRLLGWTAVGPWRTPSYFLLERHRRIAGQAEILADDCHPKSVDAEPCGR